MTDEELARRVRKILRKEYPFLFDRRVKKFIDFLQDNYKLAPKATHKD